MGYNGASSLSSAQDHNSSHPIDKGNTYSRKGIRMIRESILKTYGISIMWEDIKGHRDEEVN